MEDTEDMEVMEGMEDLEDMDSAIHSLAADSALSNVYMPYLGSLDPLFCLPANSYTAQHINPKLLRRFLSLPLLRCRLTKFPILVSDRFSGPHLMIDKPKNRAFGRGDAYPYRN